MSSLSIHIMIRKLILYLSIAVCTPLSSAQAATFEESDVKAAFLYYFSHFISWPESGDQANDQLVEFCSFGDDPVTQSLMRLLVTPKADNSKMNTRLVTDAAMTSGCDYVFIGVANKDSALEIIETIRGKPILTVSDIDNFTDIGGMIELKRDANRINVLINVDTLEAHQLKASSKLLSLATIVSSPGSQE